jgi:acetyl-CoA carboxylase biotin carboxyl carrier protein
MKRSELTEFAVEEEGFKLKIRRGPNGFPVTTSTGGSSGSTGELTSNPVSTGTSPAVTPNGSQDEPGVTYIKAPMVGTFYRSSSPESPPFVEVDAKIVENSVVCIIEAMKIMNEIQAETKGTLLETLVENGQPVEYGQRLFKIKQP